MTNCTVSVSNPINPLLPRYHDVILERRRGFWVRRSRLQSYLSTRAAGHGLHSSLGRDYVYAANVDLDHIRQHIFVNSTEVDPHCFVFWTMFIRLRRFVTSSHWLHLRCMGKSTPPLTAIPGGRFLLCCDTGLSGKAPRSGGSQFDSLVSGTRTVLRNEILRSPFTTTLSSVSLQVIPITAIAAVV